MTSTPNGIEIDVKPECPENACGPIPLTLTGIVTAPLMPAISFVPSFDRRSPFTEEYAEFPVPTEKLVKLEQS